MLSEKKGMSKTFIAVICVIVILIAAYLIFSSGSSTGSAVQNTNAGASQQTPQSGMVKLSDSQYANYAYLISTDPLSADAQQAITGFNIQKTSNPDGSTTYNLVAVNPEYQNQTYTIQQGQSLYFIERSLGDDSNGADNFPGDDMALVVDSNGYIVSGPGPA